LRQILKLSTTDERIASSEELTLARDEPTIALLTQNMCSAPHC